MKLTLVNKQALNFFKARYRVRKIVLYREYSSRVRENTLAIWILALGYATRYRVCRKGTGYAT
jgi:hypothetical protein